MKRSILDSLREAPLMTALVAFLALAEQLVNCFTVPGRRHFAHFMLAQATLWDAPHWVSETLRRPLSSTSVLSSKRNPGASGLPSLGAFKTKKRSKY